MMPIGANAIYDFEVDILECIRLKLIELGQPIPCRICVSPGETVWDDCGNGGQLIATTLNTYYSDVFPADVSEDITASTICGPGMVVARISISLMRCVPTVKGTPPTAPTCEELAEVALLLNRDSYAMRNGILCCLSEQKRVFEIIDFRMGSTNAEGPEGGCVGNEITILVAFMDA